MKGNILIVSGLDSTEKLGGLEKWYMKLAELTHHKSKIYIFYNKSLPLEFIIQEFEKYGIIPVVFNFTKSPSRVEDFKNFLNQNEINYVHSHFENTLWFLKYAKLHGAKTYWHLLMGNYYFYNQSWKQSLKQRIGLYIHRLKVCYYLLFVDYIYCASIGVKKEFNDFFGFHNNRKMHVNYLGLESQVLEKNKNLLHPDRSDKIVITCIAFHGAIKGVDLLIKAIAVLNTRGYTDIICNQIGGSQFFDKKDDTEQLHQLSTELKLHNFNWLGIQKNIYDHLLSTDIYCQPSRHEALSFTIMEAMSVRLPIVASHTCGIPELVHDGENGSLFQVDNYINLADCLENLINNKKLRNAMAEKSVEIINESRFAMEENIKNIIATYH